MSLSKSKCWYSNDCLHFLKRTVPLSWLVLKFYLCRGVGDKDKFYNIDLKKKKKKIGSAFGKLSFLSSEAFSRIQDLKVVFTNFGAKMRLTEKTQY
jgi:hypothetical protein